jgi:hypothetical protein
MQQAGSWSLPACKNTLYQRAMEMIVVEKSERQAELKRAALKYAKQGLLIVPCHGVVEGRCTCKAGRNCKSPGKHPRQRNWQGVASCDSATVAAWWNKWPRGNVGVATGAQSGIVVLDFDGEAGERSLQELVKRDPLILNTRVHRSGSGGTHLFFRGVGSPVRNAIGLRPGMDVRADGGLIILPPSNHASGHSYTVVSDAETAILPESLCEVVRCHKEDDDYKEDEGSKVVKRMKQGKGEKKAGSKKLVIPDGVSDQIEQALIESLPDSPGLRHKRVFDFARGLLAIDGISQDIPAVEFRPYVKRWFSMAQKKADRRGFTIKGDFEETWTDFAKGWEQVRFPKGVGLRPVFDHVHKMQLEGEVEPVAWNASVYFERATKPDYHLLISVLFELSKRAGGRPFCLACTAGAVEFNRLGFEHVTSNWIHRRLKTFNVEGILKCIDGGRAGAKGIGKAALYQWTWTKKESPMLDHQPMSES